MDGSDVIVLGAGVIGLTTAVTLREARHRVAVVAEEIPGSTSLAAGASWGPYLVEPQDKVNTWSSRTLRGLTELAGVPGSGVRLVSGVEASRTAAQIPSWTAHLPDVEECSQHELPPGFKAGWRYSVPVVDMPRHLDYLIERFNAAGGDLERRHVGDLAELTSTHPILVNCTGLGARDLTGDRSVYPIRGQLVTVKNPGIETFFSEDTGDSPELTHYLPQGDTLVLGGTAATHHFDLKPDPSATQTIIARCAAVEPRLAGAEVLQERVGLRPTRPHVRVERESHGTGQIIHNYGHGGAGVSLAWGCAQDVLAMLRD